MNRLMAIAGLDLALVAGLAAAQQPVPPAAERHVRGEVVALHGDTLELRSQSGETLKLKVDEGAHVNLVGKGDIGSIGKDAFIGTTAVPQRDGTLRAIEVHVFSDSLRGSGEGHRPWDLQPGSTMTNATVARADQAGGGSAQSGGTGSTMTNATVARVDEGAGARKLSLRYKGGEKTVIVPSGTPVVTVEPGDRSKLVPGVHVFAVVSPQRDGTLVAQRLNVGKEGVVPPM